jgi:hypothetical protein
MIRQQILRQHPEAAKAMFEHPHSETEQNTLPEKAAESQTNGFHDDQITEAAPQDTNGHTGHSAEEAIDEHHEVANRQLDTEKAESSSPPRLTAGLSAIETDTETKTEKDNKVTMNIHTNQTKPKCGINAILIDFFLYDTMKQLEDGGKEGIPHHRTRSIWY